PKGQDIMLTSIQIPYQDTRNGTPRLELHMEAVARDNKVIENLQQKIEDDRHDVVGTSVKVETDKNDKNKAKYPWKLDEHVEVKPPAAGATAATVAKTPSSSDSKATASSKTTGSEKAPAEKTSGEKSPSETSAVQKSPFEKPAEKSNAGKSDAGKTAAE